MDMKLFVDCDPDTRLSRRGKFIVFNNKYSAQYMAYITRVERIDKKVLFLILNIYFQGYSF